jgi:hypothetical protein
MSGHTLRQSPGQRVGVRVAHPKDDDRRGGFARERQQVAVIQIMGDDYFASCLRGLDDLRIFGVREPDVASVAAPMSRGRQARSELRYYVHVEQQVHAASGRGTIRSSIAQAA